MKTRKISDVINELAKLSDSSRENGLHFDNLTKCMRFRDYDAAYTLAMSGAKAKSKSRANQDFFRNAYQQKLDELIPLIKPLTPVQKQERLAELLVAVKQRNVDRIEVLLESGSVAVLDDKLERDSQEGISRGETALALALKKLDPAVVKTLIKYGATLDDSFPVNKPISKNGDTTLHFACLNGIPELAVQSIQAGADVNTHDKESMTPLLLASFRGYYSIARLLLNKGADPNLGYEEKTNEYYITPFKVCMHDFRMARDLIEFGYKYDDEELDVAKRTNHELYQYMKQPLRERKKSIIAKGSAEDMLEQYDFDENIKPILRNLYIENPELRKLFCMGLDQVYKNKNKILKPLLDLVAKATAGELVNHEGELKALKIIVVDSEDIHCVSAGDDDGVYKGKNTVYIAGAVNPEAAFGTMLHELKHYADKQVFGDTDTPYREGQQYHFQVVKERLAEVVKQIGEMSPVEIKAKYTERDMRVYETIISIFDDYDEEDQSAEVMVKVPEIIGMLGVDEGYKWLEENERALLKFYELKFNRSCQNYLKQNQQLELGPVMSPESSHKG